MVWNIDPGSEHFFAGYCLLLSYQWFIIPCEMSWQTQAFPCCPTLCSYFPAVLPLQLHAFATQTCDFLFFFLPPPLLASRAAVWHSQCTGVAVHWLCTHIEISYTHRSKWHAAHTASWCCLCYTVWCCLCLQGVCRNERMYVSEWLSGRACRCLVRAWVKRRYYAVPITVIDTLHLP